MFVRSCNTGYCVTFRRLTALPEPIVTDDAQIAHTRPNLRTDPQTKQPTGTAAYTLLPLLPNDPELRESPQLAHTIGAGIARLDRALAELPLARELIRR